MIVVPPQAGAQGPAPQANQILGIQGLLPVEGFLRKYKCRWSSRIELRWIGNAIAELLVKGAVVQFDAGFEFMDPVVRSDAALGIALAKASLLSRDNRGGEFIGVQTGGVV